MVAVGPVLQTIFLLDPSALTITPLHLQVPELVQDYMAGTTLLDKYITCPALPPSAFYSC
jgi:hypothetical protein